MDYTKVNRFLTEEYETIDVANNETKIAKETIIESFKAIDQNKELTKELILDYIAHKGLNDNQIDVVKSQIRNIGQILLNVR